MLITQNFINCYSSSTNLSYIFLKNRKRRLSTKHSTISFAKKREFSEKSKVEENSISSLKIPRNFLVQAVVGVFALGFIDAGYSGDWSRIGVISKDNEDLLKIAACLIVPLCLFVIFSFSKKIEE
ncbi:hypothetical protein R3W88_018784 [Solanum pinnatisectum]|uniref:DUF7887 domain-containing protein n=1 Tax=Solanum pinnatisectum TaxID=50273 RepID=A0AAV9KIE8_9SOLN|nr:hypothetical protein R3W88_018784 [Solanum pinnatisectum]